MLQCTKSVLKIAWKSIFQAFNRFYLVRFLRRNGRGKRMTHTQRRRFSVTVERTIPVTYLRSESSMYMWASSTVEHQTFIYFRWYQKRNHEPPTPIFILFKAVHLINGLGQMAWFQDNKKENVHSFVFLLSNYSITWPFWLSGNLQNIWYVSCR